MLGLGQVVGVEGVIAERKVRIEAIAALRVGVDQLLIGLAHVIEFAQLAILVRHEESGFVGPWVAGELAQKAAVYADGQVLE